MGARGPVPKRSAERRRRNKDAAVETVKPITLRVKPPAAKAHWHPIAKAWYKSLGESGQAQFYEPSDWWYAQYVAEALSRNLKQGAKFSSMLFAAVLSAMNDLLTTEGARRRVRLEIERGGEPDQPASVTAISEYRERLKPAKRKTS